MTTPSFIAFASHPALRQRYVEARAMLVADADDGRIVWANASGASGFGYATIGDAIGNELADPIIRRQFQAAAGRLTAPGDSERFTIHVTRGFRRAAVAATVTLFVLSQKRYVLIECEADQRAPKNLVEGPGDLHLALIDGEGRVLEHSTDFTDAEIDEDEIDGVLESLRRRPESHVERLITSESGIWPVALGRLSSDPERYLLAVSPDLSADVRQEPQPPARSPLDVIAAIDDSLGALIEDIDETPPPVIRRAPAPAKAAPEPSPELDAQRALPLRFVWRSDIDGRIVETSGELVEAVGDETGTITGLSFSEIEAQLGVTGAGAIGDLVQSTETWSGRTVEWPISGTDMVVPVDLAALPTFTRERRFDGFRGFGLVRRGEEKKSPKPQPVAPKRPAETAKTLTADERNALDEIALQLRAAAPAEETPAETEDAPRPLIRRKTAAPAENEALPDTSDFDGREDPIVIQSGDRVLYANHAFLTISGYGSLEAVIAAGGTDAFVERGSDDRLFLRTADGTKLPVSFHMQAITWQGGRALALTLRPESEHGASANPVIRRVPQAEPADESAAEVTELSSILDTATDGILILDGDQRIRSLSASASALFATDTADVAGEPVDVLFAEESHSDLSIHLKRMQRAGEVSSEGLEVIGREAGGGLIPLYVTLGRLPQSDGICVVLRDITALKRREDDLRSARREAREAQDEREDFLSALRYELRQPIDAIVSLSETMDHQAFGPMGDGRYHAIAREIALKGRHARGVIGRLLGEAVPEPEVEPAPLPKQPEAQAANTEGVAPVNDAIAEAVSMVQPRANSRRIIIRAALSPGIGSAGGSSETLRDIAHELLLGAVQFTPAGGQVVVSSALTPEGGIVLRFRDNGIAPSRRRIGNGGARIEQGEPDNSHLAKARALADSLGARLVVNAVPNEGMLVEVFLSETQTRPLHY